MTTMRFYLLVMLTMSLPSIVFAGGSPTLCEKDEATLFACPIKKKVVSYCAVPTTPPYYSLSYRYGTPGKIEKSYRVGNDKFADADNMFVHSQPLGPKQTVDSIWFMEPNGITTSLLECGGGNCMSSNPGIVVMKGKKTLAKLICSNYDVMATALDKFPVKQGDNGGLVPNDTELLVEKENPGEPEEIFVKQGVK